MTVELKIKRARTAKTVEAVKERLLAALHGTWIAYAGYDRSEHEEELRRLIKLANARIKELK